jgi:hypothetical protein
MWGVGFHEAAVGGVEWAAGVEVCGAHSERESGDRLLHNSSIGAGAVGERGAKPLVNDETSER